MRGSASTEEWMRARLNGYGHWRRDRAYKIACHRQPEGEAKPKQNGHIEKLPQQAEGRIELTCVSEKLRASFRIEALYLCKATESLTHSAIWLSEGTSLNAKYRIGGFAQGNEPDRVCGLALSSGRANSTQTNTLNQQRSHIINGAPVGGRSTSFPSLTPATPSPSTLGLSLTTLSFSRLLRDRLVWFSVQFATGRE